MITMAEISQRITSKNPKTPSYDKIIKMIVNLDGKKCDKNDDSSPKLSHPHSSL